MNFEGAGYWLLNKATLAALTIGIHVNISVLQFVSYTLKDVRRKARELTNGLVAYAISPDFGFTNKRLTRI